MVIAIHLSLSLETRVLYTVLFIIDELKTDVKILMAFRMFV